MLGEEGWRTLWDTYASSGPHALHAEVTLLAERLACPALQPHLDRLQQRVREEVEAPEPVTAVAEEVPPEPPPANRLVWPSMLALVAVVTFVAVGVQPQKLQSVEPPEEWQTPPAPYTDKGGPLEVSSVTASSGSGTSVLRFGTGRTMKDKPTSVTWASPSPTATAVVWWDAPNQPEHVVELRSGTPHAIPPNADNIVVAEASNVLTTDEWKQLQALRPTPKTSRKTPTLKRFGELRRANLIAWATDGQPPWEASHPLVEVGSVALYRAPESHLTWFGSGFPVVLPEGAWEVQAVGADVAPVAVPLGSDKRPVGPVLDDDPLVLKPKDGVVGYRVVFAPPGTTVSPSESPPGSRTQVFWWTH